MSEHKRQWVDYMIAVMKPANGLEQACRDMLSERYETARKGKGNSNV